MTIMYLYEPGTHVSIKENRLEIKSKNDLETSIPITNVEGMILFGNIQLTNKVFTFLLENDIPVTWLSHSGKFYGRLESTKAVDIYKQRRQFKLGEDEEFCLEFSKKIISAKISNQIVILRRYNRHIGNDELKIHMANMKSHRNSVHQAKSLDKVLGYEGIASRYYFDALSK